MTSTVTVEQKLVISYHGGDKEQHWIPEDDTLQELNGKTFITIGHSNRAFARFCKGNMSLTNPLKTYKFLDELVKLRASIVEDHLDKLATEKLINHVAGRPVNQKVTFVDHLPKYVTVSLPEVQFGGETAGPITMDIVTEIHSKRKLAIECTDTALHYVRFAMQASVTEEIQRARPAHAERLSANTGIKGVHTHFKKGDTHIVRCRVPDADGRITTKCVTFRGDIQQDLQQVCKRLKTSESTSASSESSSSASYRSPCGGDAVEDDTSATGQTDAQTDASAASGSVPEQQPTLLSNEWRQLFKR
jgi:hypothetical protein